MPVLISGPPVTDTVKMVKVLPEFSFSTSEDGPETEGASAPAFTAALPPPSQMGLPAAPPQGPSAVADDDEAVLAKAFPGLFGADEKLTSKEETAYPVEAPSSPRRRSSSGKLMDAMNPFKRRGSKGQ